VLLSDHHKIIDHEHLIMFIANVLIAAVVVHEIGHLIVLETSGLLLYSLGILDGSRLSKIANLNGVLVLYNLLPIGMFDGGRFVKILFDSIPEDKDGSFVLIIAAIFYVATLLLSALTNNVFLFSVPLLLWGLHHYATHDDPEGSYSSKAMTETQIGIWTFVYILLLLFGAVTMSVTQPWFL